MRASTFFSVASAVLAFGALVVAARRNAPEELELERLTIVDKDGEPRLVLANSEKSPAAVLDGEEVADSGGRPGMIFFNSEGDECGGLVFDSVMTPDGTRETFGQLTFDQYKQDQTLVLRYLETDGKRGVGLTVQDRSDGVNWKEWQPIRQLPDGPEKERAFAEFSKRHPWPRRLFVGKRPDDGASTVLLADSDGVPRLRLLVDTGGDPRIEFLDDQGQVTKVIRGE